MYMTAQKYRLACDDMNLRMYNQCSSPRDLSLSRQWPKEVRQASKLLTYLNLLMLVLVQCPQENGAYEREGGPCKEAKLLAPERHGNAFYVNMPVSIGWRN
jgi:hypothetical protein